MDAPFTDSSPAWSLKNPYTAQLAARRPLNGPGSAKNIQHLEIAIGADGPLHEPGDSLGVIARNCPQLVDDILQAVGADGGEAVSDADGVAVDLRQVLSRREITKVPKPLLQLVAEKTGDTQLLALFEAEHKDELAEYRSGRDVLDVLREHPSAALSPQELASNLGRLAPRLYSIASSRAAHPDAIHLTVGVVCFDSRGRMRKGVCSNYLGDRIQTGGEIKCYVHHAKNFKLPAEPEAAVIMVGPGTGIAPFRAFLQERHAQAASGRNWLFFGDQHQASDYLYGDEFAALQLDGLLSRVDLAFSRDQTEKVYVQHRMRENAQQLWAWLEDGAYFYVCGDALRMAKDVDAELLRICSEVGGLGDDAAVEYVKALKKSKRYQRDVYAV